MAEVVKTGYVHLLKKKMKDCEVCKKKKKSAKSIPLFVVS